MKKLLIVEDDDTMAIELSKMFIGEGFQARVLKSFREAESVNLADFDLAIVDWHLPDGEGIDLVRRWRLIRSTFPILMLTARAQVADKLIGLELGANDYITKPFEPLELVARVRRHLTQVEAFDKPERKPEPLEIGGIRLDSVSHQVWHLGALVTLTKLQYTLLKYFMEHPGEAFSRDEILNRVWGYENYPSTRTVDNHIAQLRQMFDSRLFETLHGVGYRFNGRDVDKEDFKNMTRS